MLWMKSSCWMVLTVAGGLLTKRPAL